MPGVIVNPYLKKKSRQTVSKASSLNVVSSKQTSSNKNPVQSSSISSRKGTTKQHGSTSNSPRYNVKQVETQAPPSLKVVDRKTTKIDTMAGKTQATATLVQTSSNEIGLQKQSQKKLQQKVPQAKVAAKSKAKTNIKASFKAQLRKEITHLKRQKKLQNQQSHNLKIQRLKEEQKQQRIADKLRLEDERKQRREEKIVAKEKEKELLRMKLKRDLEMKQRIEEEKVEKKRREKEEREKVKEEKRVEREEKKKLEMEKKQFEAQRRAEETQQAMREKMLQTNTGFGFGMGMDMMNQSYYAKHEIQNHQAPTLSTNLAPQGPMVPFSSHAYSSYYSTPNPLNTFYYSNSLMNYTIPQTSNYATSQHVSQLQFFNFHANNFMSLFSHRMQSRREKVNSSTTKSTNSRKKQPKSMILHNDPLNVPSPFAKTHVLLPHTIVIYKEEGQSYGINLRYETRGTLVELQENSAEKGHRPTKSQVKTVDTSESIKTSNVNISSLPLPTEGHSKVILGESASSSLPILQEPLASKMEATIGEELTIKNNVGIPNEKTDNIPLNGNLNSCYEEEKASADPSGLTDRSRSPLLQDEGMEATIKILKYDDISNSCDTVVQDKVSTKLPSANTDKEEDRDGSATNLYLNSKEIPSIANDTQKQCQTLNNGPFIPLNDASKNQVTVNQTIGSTPPVPKKAKRKKVTFGVMSVISAQQQNNRERKGVTQDKLIQTNDIILKIDNENLSGLTFQQAAQLFSKAGSSKTEPKETDDGSMESKKIVKCVLTIAREKKVIRILNKLASLDRQVAPVSKKEICPLEDMDIQPLKSVESKSQEELQTVEKIPFVIDESKGTVLDGEFSSLEINALIYGVRLTFGNYMSFVEGSDSQKILSPYGITAKNPAFKDVTLRRNSSDFVLKWFHETNQIEKNMTQKALNLLKEEWKAENEIYGTKFEAKYMLESQRNIMRNLPRMSQGCKCGSLNHQYVSDSKCILYRNLRKYLNGHQSVQHKEKPTEAFEKYNGKLNSIGSAHLQRIKKLKEEGDAERAEAEFVTQMENIQTTLLKKSIFSPNILTVLALSSIATLCDTSESFGKIDDDETIPTRIKEEINEDMPLQALGKRQAESECNNGVVKKPRLEEDHVPNSYCLAWLLMHISKTWGHTYKEPDHIDHSFYEMCKSGDMNKNKIANYDRNPREPQQFPFEILKYILEEPLMNRLKKQAAKIENVSDQHIHIDAIPDEVLVLHLASDLKTGLMKELKYLAESGMVKINRRGFVSLRDEWQKKLHPFVLNEMSETGWSKEADTDNKFCIHPKIRDGISAEWKKMPDGWFSKSEKSVRHYHHEYEISKQTFESNFEDAMNKIDGIAQFGI